MNYILCLWYTNNTSAGYDNLPPLLSQLQGYSSTLTSDFVPRYSWETGGVQGCFAHPFASTELPAGYHNPAAIFDVFCEVRALIRLTDIQRPELELSPRTI